MSRKARTTPRRHQMARSNRISIALLAGRVRTCTSLDPHDVPLGAGAGHFGGESWPCPAESWSPKPCSRLANSVSRRHGESKSSSSVRKMLLGVISSVDMRSSQCLITHPKHSTRMCREGAPTRTATPSRTGSSNRSSPATPAEYPSPPTASLPPP